MLHEIISSRHALVSLALALFPAATSAQQPAPAAVRNIVLVHGAFADGTSWSKVIPLLEAMGYHVVAVQNPLTSLADDVAATRRIIALQGWPRHPGRALLGRCGDHAGRR